MRATNHSQSISSFDGSEVPIWREVLVGFDWLVLHASSVWNCIGVPGGDESPIILIPGFLGNDAYLADMYNWLSRLGYQPFLSGIGRNADCPEKLTNRLFQTIDQVCFATGYSKVRLIGHSLGGTIARSAAARRPSQIAQVITLGSPISYVRAHPFVLATAVLIGNNNRSRRPEETQPQCYTQDCSCSFVRSIGGERVPDTVSVFSIYTKRDGVVDWHCCLDSNQERNLEVESTHIGLAFSSDSYRVIARALSVCEVKKRAVA